MPIHTPPRLSIVLPLVKVHIPYLTTLSLVGDRGFLFFSTPLLPLYHPLFTRSGPLRASQGHLGWGVDCGFRPAGITIGKPLRLDSSLDGAAL